MYLLLNIKNLKIYIKISYIHSTQYAHHNLKYMLPQCYITYNDVSLLIILTEV